MSWANHAGNKYGNKKIEHAGHWFDSRLEAALFDLLSLHQCGGEISSLSHHPGTVFLGPARVQYRPDFRWKNEKTGIIEHGEAKGFPNDKWPLKKRLWKFHGPGPLFIWRGTATALKLTETIIPSNDACPTCGKG